MTKMFGQEARRACPKPARVASFSRLHPNPCVLLVPKAPRRHNSTYHHVHYMLGNRKKERTKRQQKTPGNGKRPGGNNKHQRSNIKHRGGNNTHHRKTPGDKQHQKSNGKHPAREHTLFVIRPRCSLQASRRTALLFQQRGKTVRFWPPAIGWGCGHTTLARSKGCRARRSEGRRWS